jgi:CRISPR-associated endonuclease/helicase Cas3
MSQHYGTREDGTPVSDEMVEAMASEAERGYDVEDILRRRGGRPAMGSAAVTVESAGQAPQPAHPAR